MDDIQTTPPVGMADELPESGMRTAHARLSRKRTKTGCLTCRRRRIKCGEERPTCGNCSKSKRHCEGYNQRVIFKDPLSTYRVSSLTAQTHPTSNARIASVPPSASQQNLFHYVQHTPKTPVLNLAGYRISSSEGQALADPTPPAGLPVQFGEPVDRHTSRFLPPSDEGYEEVAKEIPRAPLLGDAYYDTIEPSYLSQAAGILKQQVQNKPGTQYDFNSISTHDTKLGTTQSNQNFQINWLRGPSCASEPPLQGLVYHSDIREAASAFLTQSYQGSANWPICLSQHDPSHPKLKSYLISPSAPIAADHEPPPKSEDDLWEEANKVEKTSQEAVQHQHEPEPELRNWVMQDKLLSVAIQLQDPIPSDIKSSSLVIPSNDQSAKTSHLSEEDVFDKSDDEMGLGESDQDTLPDSGKFYDDHLENNDLGIVVALQASQDIQEQRLRTYHSFLDGPNILTSYQPSARSSPLNDRTAARIFYHYVNVTGPSISLYERHPANPSLMFQGRPIPRSQQHIWAYTMPTLALNNQALLHAMLAIGSLHIALLQDGPKMAALKHYHIAIRHVAKSVRLPMRRGQPAILAATLLLGWYELMSGEHQQWSSHLYGGTQLLKEIDFAGVTKFLKNKKLEQRQARYGNLYHHEMALGTFESRRDEQADVPESLKYDDVNEDLVGMIMGKKLRYDTYGQVLEDFDAHSNRCNVYTQRELETYETQRDLFWWYCKNDAFQSILSGNRLFLQYDWWSHCPPRAAVGKRDATYGTFDHLILLLGRLAEFASKDLKRKRKAMQANGGQWRPPSGAPVQQGSTGLDPPRQSGPPQIPSFAGMMPATEGKAKLPRGFSPPRENSPMSEDDNRSLENWTTEAEEEWQEIRTAFSILQDNFGPDFQSLGPEHCQPIESPFGSALQYRTYSIAGIWITYNMGLILCHRYHPTMPPAATVAAGLTARQTALYANEIGRISAAIAPHASQVSQVSTGVGAGLIECTFGLFIAGVQYQNPAQRSWLVQRCFDIKRLTGWQTAEAIAMGCESAWTKTAELGRGPPYTRITEKKIDQEVWHNARKMLDPLSSGELDRGRIFIARTDRVHYALGLLGVEQSLEHLDFDDDHNPNEE